MPSPDEVALCPGLTTARAIPQGTSFAGNSILDAGSVVAGKAEMLPVTDRAALPLPIRARRLSLVMPILRFENPLSAVAKAAKADELLASPAQVGKLFSVMMRKCPSSKPRFRHILK